MSGSAKNSYRQVFKATSIFGGTQVFNIVIGLIRSKLTASLLGTAGYGINSLLSAPLGLIGSLTGLGIGFSAIRNISVAHAEEDEEKFGRTVKTLRRWVWVTGLLGVLVTLILAPYLSLSSFGSRDYTWDFVALSGTFLLSSIAGGQSAVLYGTRRVKDMACSTMLGGVLGLFTAIPLYYFYGLNGIVPAIIAASFTTLLLSWYFARKVPVRKVEVSYEESFHEGLSFVKIGFMMTLSGLMGSAVAYGISVFINHIGGVSEVGLYNSGWSITERFVGMVFAAMGADYYPRLSAVSKNNAMVAEAVNQQAETGVLILGPVMLLYLLSLPLLIPLLYTREFLSVIPFTEWVVIGMLFKSVSWCLGFIALAKGDSGLFFRLEVLSTLLQTLSIMGGYTLWGLEGVGVAFVVTYIVYLLYMFIFYRKKISFSFSRALLFVFGSMQVLCITAFLAVKFLPSVYGYSVAAVMFVSACVFSLHELNKRIELKDYIQKFKNKFIHTKQGS